MRRELKLKMARLRAMMDAALSPLDPDGRDERKASAEFDDDEFARIYTPHWCSQSAPDYHGELSAGFDLRACEIQAYGAPRNHGKSTRSLIRLTREICYGQRHKITAVSASAELAQELIEPLRVGIAENPRILQDFGKLIKKGSDDNFWTTHDVHFTARGREQRMRGPRNDLILLDDIEDDKQARSKARTDELLDVIFEILYNRLIPVSDGGSTFLWVGTILARKAALARVLNLNNLPDAEFPDVVGKIWRAIMTDERGREYSLWPARFPLPELYKIRRRIGKRRFNKEYQNNPQDDDSIFTHIQGFHASELEALLQTA